MSKLINLNQLIQEAIERKVTLREIANSHGLNYQLVLRAFRGSKTLHADSKLDKKESDRSKEVNSITEKSVEPLSRSLPRFIPKNNKVADKLCLYAHLFMNERNLEPTATDLWNYMWERKNECGFEMKLSPSGEQIYYLQDTVVDPRGFRRRIKQYRVTDKLS